MKTTDLIRYVIVPLALLIFALIDVIRKKYEITKIAKDHILISRMFMAEKTLYIEDIKSVTIKDLDKNRVRVIIQSNQKKNKHFCLGIADYQSLINFCKSNNIKLKKEE